MEKDIKNIIYISSIYSLFLVLIKETNFDENFYFFDEKFLLENRLPFKNYFILKNYKNNVKIVKYLKIYSTLKKVRKYFLNEFKGKNFYFQDSVNYKQFFLNNLECKCNLIEDGTASYNNKFIENEYQKNEKRVYLKDKLVYFSPYKFLSYGLSKKVDKVYLTGILEVPKSIEKKVEKMEIKKLWTNLSDDKKEEILNIFGIKLENLKKLVEEENKILLLTQPLYEDKIITEEEKIKIYREILEKQNGRKIYIKAHPREKTNYKEVFKNFNIEVIENTFPIELFLLLNIKFDKVITLFSTGALNFKGKAEVEFIGTEKYPKLYERFGKIEMK